MLNTKFFENIEKQSKEIESQKLSKVVDSVFNGFSDFYNAFLEYYSLYKPNSFSPIKESLTKLEEATEKDCLEKMNYNINRLKGDIEVLQTVINKGYKYTSQEQVDIFNSDFENTINMVKTALGMYESLKKQGKTNSELDDRFVTLLKCLKGVKISIETYNKDSEIKLKTYEQVGMDLNKFTPKISEEIKNFIKRIID